MEYADSAQHQRGGGGVETNQVRHRPIGTSEPVRMASCASTHGVGHSAGTRWRPGPSCPPGAAAAGQGDSLASCRRDAAR
eukprot:3735878-Prymnesium_polylepis.1